MKPIRVLIIDDSALVRKLLREILEHDGSFEVVDTAMDPVYAVEKIKRLKPDVLTLDLEMPRMDGLTFLERLMRSMPIPTLVVSSLARRGAEVTLRALELGAFDFVSKPTDASRLPEMAEEIRAKLRAASTVGVGALIRLGAPASSKPKPETTAGHFTRFASTTDKLICIGASTGGTVAIERVLSGFPPDVPGIVIVQHMPPVYTHSFAERLNSLYNLQVKEAENGDTVRPGHVFIAPGNFHVTLVASGAAWVCRLNQNPPVGFHRPSVDVLFHSAAHCAGANAVGVLLTGMGEDGAKGLKAMRESGSQTMVQDEASSVVFGMPKKAIELGGAIDVLPLDEIASHVLTKVRA